MLALKSIAGEHLDPTHIAIIGHWEISQNGADGAPLTSQVRTSEIIVKTTGGWRYLFDHASIGVSPRAPAQ